jgi:hypothetical protein
LIKNTAQNLDAQRLAVHDITKARNKQEASLLEMDNIEFHKTVWYF